MHYHQLPLSARAETQQQLAWLCRRPLTRCRGIIQGRYYWPKAYLQQPHVIRPQDGYWCYQAQIPSYPLWLLPKSRWLTGLPHSNDAHIIADAPYPQHGWDPIFLRYCFVVPNHW
ncbi:MAG: DUF1853 family protein [Ferrimonas sp.]